MFWVVICQILSYWCEWWLVIVNGGWLVRFWVVVGKILSCWSGSDWWLVLRFWIVLDQGLRVVVQVLRGDSSGFELLVKFWVVICQVWNSDWFYGSQWWLVRFLVIIGYEHSTEKTPKEHNIFKRRWPFSSTPGDQGIKATEEGDHILFRFLSRSHCEKQGSYL